jgi:hypothetical protein
MKRKNMIVNKILISKNKTIYWILFWVLHSVFTNWDYVISYESRFPFWKRRIVKYKYEDYKRKVLFFEDKIDIKDIEIDFKEIYSKYFLCHDFIWHYLKKNNIELWLKFNTGKLKENAFLSLRKFYYLSLLFFFVPLISIFITYTLAIPDDFNSCLNIFKYEIQK